MLKHLEKHLTLFCCIATSSILFLTVIIMFFVSLGQTDAHELELFNKNISTILEKVRYTHMVNHNWLLQMESDNNLMIYLEDQGHPLSFNGSTLSPTPKEDLVQEIKSLALNEGVDISLNPITPNIQKSSVFALNKGVNEYYMGVAISIPFEKGWRSLVVIQYLSKKTTTLFKQLFLFLIIGLFGSAILFALSHLIVSTAIKPVAQNRQRQVEFIAAASHELRSPLTVIQAGLFSIKEELPSTNLYLPQLENECKRMNRLINDMLLLATSDAKTWNLHKEILDMDTFLIEAYDLFCPFVNAHNQQFILDFPSNPLPSIEGDVERLKQVLTILIDNAVLYTPPNKNITLRAYSNNKYVILEVADEGKGINDEEKELIFNRFYRVDKSRSNKEHFGLGLSIAQELVRLHEGKLTIKDTPQGGATFIISLKKL